MNSSVQVTELCHRLGLHREQAEKIAKKQEFHVKKREKKFQIQKLLKKLQLDWPFNFSKIDNDKNHHQKLFLETLFSTGYQSPKVNE